jgi:Outer membrane protein beta-barrel domain
MKKIILVALVLLFFNVTYSQSFLNVKVNTFRFNDYSSNLKIGLGIGHKNYLSNHKWVKLIMSESLDFKHTSFTYFEGGLGGGSSTEGNINFLNAQVDFRSRIGKNFFGEAGFYTSYSILKKITKGQVTSTQRCSFVPPGQQPICYPPSITEITNQSKDFSPFDFGLVVGVGYSFGDLTVVMDGQLGFYKILEARYNEFKSEQINLSAIFPLKN